MNKSQALFFFILTWLCILSAGCLKMSDLKQTNHPIRYYMIEYPAPPCPVNTDAILHLKRFQSVAVFNTDRMVIRPDPFTTEYDYYNRWIVKPETMITDLFFRDLGSGGIFKAVLTSPGHLLPDYELRGTIESIQAIKTSTGWEVELVLNLLFYPYPYSKTQPKADRILQKRYEKRLASPNDRPSSIVKALSECMKQFSISFQQDIADYLQKKE